ncbi:hypothetical protein H4W33_002944 [Kibdelosporangium phytohabitans]|nr:hypothetical protein [Kibdelosporangium phytohabitans]
MTSCTDAASAPGLESAVVGAVADVGDVVLVIPTLVGKTS